MCARLILFLSALSWASLLLNAEEVKYIDVSSVVQRTKLRHPPAPPTNCEGNSSCIAAASVGLSVADGAPDITDPHALGVYLVRVIPTDINPSEPLEAEFQVLNTGLAPIEIPIWPHLSDLQPSDESVTSSYLNLRLFVRVSSEPLGRDVSSVGFVELYGSPDDARTLLPLRPGEWIRVRANMMLSSLPQELHTLHLRGSFSLRNITFHPGQGGTFTEIRNLYPNITPTPLLPAHILRPTSQTKE
jgi:hypothetical protein